MPSLSMLRDEPTELRRNPVLDPLSRASPHARLHGGGAARGCGGVPRPSPRQRTTSSFLYSAKARVYENGAKESTGRVYPVAYTPMSPPQPSSGTREGRSWRDMHGENGGWVVAANCENRGGRTARFCYAEGMEMTRWSHQSASQPSKRGAQGRRLGSRRRKTGVGQIWLIWPNCAQFRFSFYIFILLICFLFILNPKFEFDTFYGFHP
jgi:hypothetical protein